MGGRSLGPRRLPGLDPVRRLSSMQNATNTPSKASIALTVTITNLASLWRDLWISFPMNPTSGTHHN